MNKPTNYTIIIVSIGISVIVYSLPESNNLIVKSIVGTVKGLGKLF